MDPLVLYTVKRTIADQCNRGSTVVSVTDTPIASIPTQIFKVETWPLLPGDRVPKLERENLLSLVFHADEQWLESVRQSDASSPKSIDAVHRQQRIFLDTLYVLHKSVSPSHAGTRRFPEAVWFACQVLHHGYQVKCLESMTSILQPPADTLYKAMREARQQVRSQALKRRTTHDADLLSTTLDRLVKAWSQFEVILYKSYGKTVLGTADDDTLFLSKEDNVQPQQQQQQQDRCFLSSELFSDTFTQLLPMTVDRSLSQPRHRRLITHTMLEDLDPIAFVAVPRLTILAGMTWLSHLSGWRRRGLKHHPNPWLSQTLQQRAAFDQLRHAVERLEASLSPQTFLERYTQLETALVQGRTAVATEGDHDADTAALLATMYQATCVVADTLLTSAHARSFTVVIRYLFAYFVPAPINANGEDADFPSTIAENTVLDLAI